MSNGCVASCLKRCASRMHGQRRMGDGPKDSETRCRKLRGHTETLVWAG